MNARLYPRFCGFYFSYFAALGIFLPFWPLYLRHLGFSGLEISQLLAVLTGAAIVAPNFWGYLADATGRRVPLIRLATFASAATALALLWVGGFYGMAAALLVFGFFWHASLPLTEGVTLSHLERAGSRYSYPQVRVWGSFGFIAACLALLPADLDTLSWEWIPLALFGCHLALFGFALSLRGRRRHREHPPHVSMANLLRHPAVFALLAAFVLMQTSHGAFYTFFSIYLDAHGYPLWSLLALWALGVGGETLVFLGFARYLAHHDPQHLFALAFLLAAVRWAVLGSWPDSALAVAGSQLLHAATFGLYHAVAVSLVHRLFPGRMQSRGQALYQSLNFGVGLTLGMLLAGLAWDAWGGQATFHAAAGVALAGMVLGWLAVRYASPLDEQTR